jgi:AcrR family transcriptional regulator
VSTEHEPAAATRPRRAGGRNRSESAHDDALRAAAEILEADGYGAVTIERVAARSGVAKSTIYRWWGSKGDLLMEAYRQLVTERMPQPDTGSLAGDLEAFVTQLYRVSDYPGRVRALRGLMAEAQLDPSFGEAFRAWVRGRRDVVAALLHRAAQRGETDPALDAADAHDHVRTLLAGFRAPRG